ncbi:MAG: hypothetical protein JXR76_24490 [Deltaproteobacteria bacterium]|nr:hypothetical protein [Deltaproteobacteria bacterium]
MSLNRIPDLILSTLLAAIMLSACQNDNKVTVLTGKAIFPLVAYSASGTQYTLMSGTFTITDETGAIVVEFDGGMDTTPEFELPTGDYSVSLADNWILYRDSVLMEDAELVSPSVVDFAIEPDETTPITYAFRVNGETVETGTGSVVLNLTVIEGNDDLPFTSDFEDEAQSLIGWNVLTQHDGWSWFEDATASLGVTSVTAADNSSNSFQLETSGFSGAEYNFDTLHPSTISFWVMFPSTNLNSGFFVTDENDATVLYMQFWNTGSITCSGLGSIGQWQPMVWQHIEFRNIDWGQGTFDTFIDGANAAANQAFVVSTATSLSTLAIYNTNDGISRWDELEIY